MRIRSKRAREGGSKSAPKPPRTRGPGTKAILALLVVGAGSLVTGVLLRRRAQDRLRHSEGEPVERPPEPSDAPGPSP